MCYLYDSYTDNASSNQTHGHIVQVQLVQAFWEILPLLFWSQCCSLPVSRLLCIVQSTFALCFVCIHSSYFSLYSPALLTLYTPLRAYTPPQGVSNRCDGGRHLLQVGPYQVRDAGETPGGRRCLQVGGVWGKTRRSLSRF